MMVRKAGAFLLAPLLALLPASVSASGLIDNVNGLTVDATGDLVHFTGLVIGKDGKIEKRLGRGDPRPERPDFRYDGKGRTLVPGLIDGHGHVTSLGFSLLNLDLSQTKSLDEAKVKIAAFAAENPGRPWIIGSSAVSRRRRTLPALAVADRSCSRASTAMPSG
jgi:imidazolonepropionase-like amidohydrolase